MKIEDVKVGDRCWVARDYPVDEYGQNATVRDLSSKGTYLCIDGDSINWFTPGVNVFWTKPEGPPKPRRKVTKTFTGWMSTSGIENIEGAGVDLGSGAGVRRTAYLWAEPHGAKHKATLTVEVEE